MPRESAKLVFRQFQKKHRSAFKDFQTRWLANPKPMAKQLVRLAQVRTYNRWYAELSLDAAKPTVGPARRKNNVSFQARKAVAPTCNTEKGEC
jgi:hypothetical protein